MLYGKLSNFSILEALQNFNFLIDYTVFSMSLENTFKCKDSFN